MSRAQIVIKHETDRALAARYVRLAPMGSRVTFEGAKRTLDQNSRMWAMLTDVVVQSPAFKGWDTDQAKAAFMIACGQEIRLMRSPISGEPFPYGKSSSKLSSQQMSELIEFMLAWGAEQNPPIVWSDPTEKQQ